MKVSNQPVHLREDKRMFNSDHPGVRDKGANLIWDEYAHRPEHCWKLIATYSGSIDSQSETE
jgi:hypothetical protein